MQERLRAMMTQGNNNKPSQPAAAPGGIPPFLKALTVKQNQLQPLNALKVQQENDREVQLPPIETQKPQFDLKPASILPSTTGIAKIEKPPPSNEEIKDLKY